MLNPLGTLIAIGFAGGWWEPLDPAPLVGRNIGVVGFYLGRLMRHRPAVVRDALAELLAALGGRHAEAARRGDVPARRRRRRRTG